MTTENRCSGGCDAAGNCACYGQGYTRGKNMGHSEVRDWDGTHPYWCGCKPCLTLIAVAAQLGIMIVKQVLVEGGLEPHEAQEQMEKIMARDEAPTYAQGDLPQLIMGLHRYAVQWVADDRDMGNP